MAEPATSAIGPHQGQPVLAAGRSLESAQGAMVLLHGRGGTAQSMLSLAEELAHPTFAYLAPQAAGSSWYPLSFLAPVERNEPYLTSALATVSNVLRRLTEAGISQKQTILLGFSQGACLALEFAARNAHLYGGVVGLSGGLIGPDDTRWEYPGSFENTPIFLGCSDVDPHIPKGRVIESADALERLGARVTTRLYANMGHTVNHDEIDFVHSLMAGLAGR